MSIYQRTWRQMFGRNRPGSTVGQVNHIIGHTEAGARLPATATVSQEIQRMKAIDSFHRSLGWQGFGYSAMVCQSGRVYEGRGYHRSGAHTVGYNHQALAWVVPGHGDRSAWSDNCLVSICEWIDEGVSSGAVAMGHKITGHRDHANKSCPGNKAYPQLDLIRDMEDEEMKKVPKPDWVPQENLQDLVDWGIDDELPTREPYIWWRFLVVQHRVIRYIKTLINQSGGVGGMTPGQRESFNQHRHDEGRTGPPNKKV